MEELRNGYTTGSCAAAATKVALTFLTSGKELEMVELITLNNEHLIIPVEKFKESHNRVYCWLKICRR